MYYLAQTGSTGGDSGGSSGGSTGNAAFVPAQTTAWLQAHVTPAVEWGDSVGVSVFGIIMIVTILAAIVRG